MRKPLSNTMKVRLAVAGLLLLHAGLASWSALQNSVTFDEYAHLPAGLSYWRYGRFDIYNYTPPLPQLLGSWPARLAGAKVPAIEPYLAMAAWDRHWQYADRFLKDNRDRYHELFVLGRLAMIPVSVLGAWLVYRWSRKLYGDVAGLLSCALYALCPNVLAHGSIVGKDICTTVGMLAAAWAWWRFCRDGSWRWWGVAVVATTAALLSKQTAILLPVAMILIAIVILPREKKAWLRAGGAYLAGMVATLILVNLCYGFQGSFRRLDSFHFTSKRMSSMQTSLPGLRLPVPGPLMEGTDALSNEMEAGAGAFLLGRQYGGSRWYYFPIALLCKLPLATLLLSIWTLGTMLRWIPPKRELNQNEWAILASLLLYLIYTMFFGQVNLGVRYVLPVLPLGFILAGRIWTPPDRRGLRAMQWTAIALLAGTALEVLIAAPRFLPFINIAWGGPGNGYTVVNDSNFDWGQGLIDLKEWMQETGVKRVNLAYFGSVEPSVYGIDYVPLSKESDDEYVAISTFFLAGLPQRLHTREGVTEIAQLEFAEELRQMTPVARPGWSIYVFTRSDYNKAQALHGMKNTGR